MTNEIKSLWNLGLNWNPNSDRLFLPFPDAVPKPVLSISPLLSNQSAELCNMTVNCSIQEEWVMSVCGQESCTVTNRSLHRYYITIVAANNTIICIGSNQVSNSSVSASTDLCQSRKWIHVLVQSNLSFGPWGNHSDWPRLLSAHRPVKYCLVSFSPCFNSTSDDTTSCTDQRCDSCRNFFPRPRHTPHILHT